MSDYTYNIEDKIGRPSPVCPAVNAFLRVRHLELEVDKVEIVKIEGWSIPRYELKIVCNGCDFRFSESNIDKLDEKCEFLHFYASVCDHGDTSAIISKNENDAYKTDMYRLNSNGKISVVFDKSSYVLDENTTWYVISFCSRISEVWSGVRDFMEDTEDDVSYHLVNETKDGDEINRTTVF